MKLWIEKELFQWEQNRYVNVSLDENDENITYVQFYNNVDEIGLKIPLENGKAKIPDYLLKESLPIMAVACTGSEGSTQVIGRRQFKIIRRARPEDLVEADKHVIYDGGEEV